jgi:hypothetical protein
MASPSFSSEEEVEGYPFSMESNAEGVILVVIVEHGHTINSDL